MRNKEHDIMFHEVDNYLKKYAVDEEARYCIAPLIALKSLEMNHLYQDACKGQLL